MKAVRGGKKGGCIPSIWVHGSGRHSMCEHACSDKLTSSGVCRFDSPDHSSIRVFSPQERGRLGTNYASMRHLTNQFPAPRAAPTDSAIPPFGCALLRREHVLSDELISSTACGFDSLHRSPIRVWHSLCEHLLSDKPTFSAACGASKFRRPIIRVFRV